MTIHEIREELTRLQDPAYRELQIRIIPTVKAETILGVRTPELRRMAKQLSRTEDTGALLADLPHAYFEENQLHAFIVSGIREYGDCIAELEWFLPYVDNWATCDQMSPRVFRKHRQELRESIWRWIDSGKTYSVRFGIGMLMEHYLEEDFDPVYPEKAAAVRSKEYYINMMIAWYFATALAKQYETVLPFLEKHRLEPWRHNNTIQKACESDRIAPDQKEYLRKRKTQT